MSSLNKIMIIGSVGQTPVVRYTAGGEAIANVSLATNSSWKDKTTGEKKEETEWHRVVFYKKLAEIVGQYVKKGGSIYVEGRLKTRKWTDKDGVEKYTTEILADQMQLLGGHGNSNGEQQSPAPRNTKPAAPKPSSMNSTDDDDDSIPF